MHVLIRTLKLYEFYLSIYNDKAKGGLEEIRCIYQNKSFVIRSSFLHYAILEQINMICDDINSNI